MIARWTEDRGRAAVKQRSGGDCEVCRAAGTEASHRVDRSDGGTWSPVNLLWACTLCHQWWHSNPVQAYQGGWRLRSTVDPLTAPVWLSIPLGQGWWWLTEDAGYRWEPVPPVTLPPGVVLR